MKINTFALQQLLAGEDIFMVAKETTKTIKETGPVVRETNQDSTKNLAPLYRPKHKVVILVHGLNVADTELLEKILGAVQLTLQNVEIIELTKQKDLNLSHIFTQKIVNQLISFGVMMSEVDLMLRLTPYQILESKGIKFLSSVSLTDLQNDIPKKKLLWAALKEMF